MRRRATLLVAAAAAIGLVLTADPAPSATAGPRAESSARYEVYDARTLAQRNLIAGTGAAIEGVEHSIVTVTATQSEVKALRALGFPVKPVPVDAPSEGSIHAGLPVPRLRVSQLRRDDRGGERDRREVPVDGE
jgi:carboxypeptidase T